MYSNWSDIKTIDTHERKIGVFTMINKEIALFAKDYYRMTGKEFKNSIYDNIQILIRHNLKYMWWWRHKDRKYLKFIAKVMLFRFSRKYGLEIGNAQIGAGIYLGHPYNITINPSSIIGENVNIHKGATIGAENRGKRKGAPRIGNNVYIGLNATIVGKIVIGDDVMIAPNSYINRDVPSHSIVIGNPAQIIARENATEGYVNFC